MLYTTTEAATAATKPRRGRPPAERATMGGNGPARVRLTWVNGNGQADAETFDSEAQALRLLSAWARHSVLPSGLKIERRERGQWVGA